MANSVPSGEDRLVAAFGRLDRALLRVEVAADRPVDAALAARHARLRDAAADALIEIDRLLEPR